MSTTSDSSDSEMDAYVNEALANYQQDSSSDESSCEPLQTGRSIMDSENGENASFVIDRSAGGINTAINISINAAASDSDDDEKTNLNDKEREWKKNDPAQRGEGNSETEKHRRKTGLSSALNPGMDLSSIYVSTDLPSHKNSKLSAKRIEDLILNKGTNDEVMKKSVFTPDFEQKHEIPPYEVSLNQQKKQRRAARAQTKGRGWFDMREQEMTDEKKNDLLVVRMRGALDPKRFYKAPDAKALPKFFHSARVVEHAADFYHSRIPKKQRKATLVDELLADADFRKYNKRKQEEIQAHKAKSTGAYRHMKRLKKRKK